MQNFVASNSASWGAEGVNDPRFTVYDSGVAQSGLSVGNLYGVYGDSKHAELINPIYLNVYLFKK